MATIHFLKKYVDKFKFTEQLNLIEFYNMLINEDEKLDVSDLGCIIVKRDDRVPIVVSCIKKYFKTKNMPKTIYPNSNIISINECYVVKKALLAENDNALAYGGSCKQCYLHCIQRRLRGEINSR